VSENYSNMCKYYVEYPNQSIAISQLLFRSVVSLPIYLLKFESLRKIKLLDDEK